MTRKLCAICYALLILLSCNSDDNGKTIDCAAVLCAAADNTIYLKFSSPDKEVDLIENGDIDTNLMTIVNEQNDEISFTVETYPDMGIYLAIPVATNTFGPKHFTINFEEGDSFTINFETSFSEGGECCGPYTILEAYEIDNYSFDLIEPSPLPVLNTVYIPNLN
ncbi:hypothetical protein [Flagellimonas sp. GZD32]|uniref:hypothetical protein n=1 Tax=Flagellimonas cixiensis TaxID=3228750 RepID=UPI0035C8D79F